MTSISQFPGLNIQHDANHGAISRIPSVNRVLGASQNWIGGSAIAWIHQHVVQHHIHTNDLNLDPDISGENTKDTNFAKYENVCKIFFRQCIHPSEPTAAPNEVPCRAAHLLLLPARVLRLLRRHPESWYVKQQI